MAFQRGGFGLTKAGRQLAGTLSLPYGENTVDTIASGRHDPFNISSAIQEKNSSLSGRRMISIALGLEERVANDS